MNNPFKKALAERRLQIGLWLAMANAYATEVSLGAGFDWLLIDGEHAPNDVRSILAQLHAIGAHRSNAVVRPPHGEPWLLKQLLDIGARTLLIPMIETVEQATAAVAAVRYPPKGIRGVGSALARVSDFNRDTDYLLRANEEVCLLLQLESAAAMPHIEAIAAIDGVDGIFIGPADLAASMGYLGKPGAEPVQAAVRDGLTRIVATGKAAGVLTSDETLSRAYIELGATFVAVGSDVGLLSRATSDLAARFRNAATAGQSKLSGDVY